MTRKNHAMTMNTAAHISDVAAPDDLFSPVPPSYVLDGSVSEFIQFATEEVALLEELLHNARYIKNLAMRLNNGSLTKGEVAEFTEYEQEARQLHETVNGPNVRIEEICATPFERLAFKLQLEMVSRAAALFEDCD
jgi:hypothetical protein